jgi:hypothetical protein
VRDGCGERLWAGLPALLLALILFDSGFALRALWWIAVIMLVVWLLGFVRPSADPGSRPQGSLRSLAIHHPQPTCGLREHPEPTGMCHM